MGGVSCAKNHDIKRRRAVVKLPRAREKEREEDTVCSVVHIIFSRDVTSEIHTRDTQVSYVTIYTMKKQLFFGKIKEKIFATYMRYLFQPSILNVSRYFTRNIVFFDVFPLDFEVFDIGPLSFQRWQPNKAFVLLCFLQIFAGFRFLEVWRPSRFLFLRRIDTTNMWKKMFCSKLPVEKLC